MIYTAVDLCKQQEICAPFKGQSPDTRLLRKRTSGNW